MSDYRTDVEDALSAMLAAAPGLEDVKTCETSIRECLFTGDKLTQGFRTEELPAIAISAQLKPATSAPFTFGEEGHRIPVSITVVTRHQRKRAALAQAAELQQAVLACLKAARKSGNPLGANVVVVGEIASSATAIEEKPYSFALNTAEFTVLKIVEL